MKIATLVIDDDPDSRMIIRTYLSSNCPDLVITGEGASVKAGRELIGQLDPDLLLLDIELPDGTAFEILENISEKKFEVIFITAYNTYAVQAFKMAAIDYLLKPLDFAELDTALQRLKARIQEKYFASHWETFFYNSKQKELYERKLAIATVEGYFFTDMKEISHLESHSNYTHFYFSNGKKLISSHTLGYYEELLPPEFFFRIHHSFIINTSYVEKFTKEGAGGIVLMKAGAELIVSQRRKEEFLRHPGLGIKLKK